MNLHEWRSELGRRKETIKQVLRFGISGGIAVLLGLVSIYVLTDIFHVWYVVSSIIAFTITFLVSFSMQKFWTFREKTISRIPVQGSLSLMLGGLNFVLNVILIYILVDFLHISYLIAQVIIYAFFGALDFFIYKLVIFKSQQNYQ